jgi:hypothetical protein
MLRMLSMVALLAVAGCGGGDDEGDDTADDGAGDDGDDGGDDGAAVDCEGSVSGDASGDFVMCASVVNHYPDGSVLVEGRDGWLFSLIVGGVIGMVDSPLDSVGLNFELAGDPVTGAFALSDAVPGVTSAVVSLEDDSFYGALVDADLAISSLEQVTDQVIEGERTVSFDVTGQLDMTLEDESGAQVLVSATF